MTHDLQQHRKTDEALERLLGDALRTAETSSEGTTCPDVALWHELALGELPDERAAELNAHAANCALCDAERVLAASFRDELADDAKTLPEETHRQPPVAAASRFTSVSSILAVAATLLLAIAGVLWLRSTPAGLPPVQGPGSGEILRSGAGIVLESPIGTLTTLPRRFDWRPSPGVTGYTLRIERVDGELLIERETESAGVDLVEEEVALLREFVTYDWIVTASTENGDTLRSDRQSFVARPANSSGSPVDEGAD